MSWELILKALSAEAAAIWSAPISFGAALLLASGVVYMIARWVYSTVIRHKDERIASLEERVKLREDQLANKLQTTSPDEAKAMIEALEARIAKMGPRRLAQEQRAAIAEAIRLPHGQEYMIGIVYDGGGGDSQILAGDFVEVFGGVRGWKVGSGMVIGPGKTPQSGIGLQVRDAKNLEPAERLVADAFKKAKLEFDFLQQGRMQGENVGLLITAKREPVS